MRMQSILVMGLVIFALPAALLAADVYRYVDKDGVVHYTDKPAGKKAEAVELPPLQVISPFEAPEIEPFADSPPRQGKAPESPSVEVVYPTPDETFRQVNAGIPIRLSLNKPLPDGYGLKYLVDGRPQNSAPIRDLDFAVSGIERGQHLISAAVIDANGREVSRATPVIIHMKPPRVGRN